MNVQPPSPALALVPNAAHAFGGVWRLTARRLFTPTHWLIIAGFCGLLVLFSLPAAPSRAAAAQGFLPWASRFYVCFLVPILAFISASSVMREDLKSESVDYVFTRPIRRPLFILFRYLAHVACTQIDFLVSLVAVVGIGLYREVPGLWPALPLLLGAQMMAIVAFSAFGFFAGALTSRALIVGVLYGAIIEVGIGNVPTQLNQLSMVRHVLALMRPILGEGQMGATAAAAELVGVGTALTALLGFAIVMLAATAAVFSFKELAAGGQRDA